MDPATSSSSCPEYPKIETLFDRDKKTFKVIEGQLRCPEFALVNRWVVTEKVDGINIRVVLKPDDPPLWPWRVRFYGRTSRAQIPTFLLEYLKDTFKLERMVRLWRGRSSCERCRGTGWYDSNDPTVKVRNPLAGLCDCVEPYPITLYGEGYGAWIQKGGGNYRPDSVSFRLFDVYVGGKWLSWSAVKDIAERVGIERMPEFSREDFENIIGCKDIDSFLDAIVLLVKPPGFNSSVAQSDRPDLNWDETWIPGEGIVARTDPYLYDWRGRPLRFKLKTSDFAL